MAEYGCSVCNYRSNIKKNVQRHIDKKLSCGKGDKTIKEIKIDIKCEFCNKNFSSITSQKYHIKNTCKNKDSAKDEEIRKLREENKLLKETATSNTTHITNITNANFIIVVNDYENTNLDKLTDKTLYKIITDSDEIHKIIPRLIKEVHFNPNVPENHNIYISNRNKNNKFLRVFRNGHWEIENKIYEIDNLINDKETNLSDWVAEKGEKYPDAKERYDEYLDQKHDNEETLKMVREEVELILYNGGKLIKT